MNNITFPNQSLVPPSLTPSVLCKYIFLMTGTKSTAKKKQKTAASDGKDSKPKQKSTTKRGKTVEPEGLSDNEVDVSEGEVEGKNKKTDGKKAKNTRINLQEAIVTTIEDHKEIKQKLYPPPGANLSTADGGGNKKTVAHWQICEEVFSEHPVYKDAFKAALDANPSTPSGKKIRDSWSGGVKAQLRRMEIKTNEIRNAMGQTGMGLTSADDIDMNIDSSITNAWQMYGEKYPWFFRFRDIIGERPNLVLTGVGNSSTPINLDGESALDDVDLSLPATSDYDADMAEDVKESVNDEMEEDGPGDEVSISKSTGDGQKSKKRKADEVITPSTAKKTAPRKGDSKPAAPVKVNSGKKSRMDEFSEIAKAEEATRQAELQVESKKMDGENQKYRVFESVSKMKHEGKMKRFEMKMELRRQELEYKKMKLAGGPGRVTERAMGFSIQTTPAHSQMLSALMPGVGEPPKVSSSSSLRLDDDNDCPNHAEFDYGSHWGVGTN
ncbi:hypothetical protein PM082_022136 [Marasmius tenuissimus]|nr:hypothetical protein PM082_022136 [Marasmius tenuissimus]